MELVFVLVGFLVGAFVVFAFKRIQDQNTKKSAKDEADRILNKAKSESLQRLKIQRSLRKFWNIWDCHQLRPN